MAFSRLRKNKNRGEATGTDQVVSLLSSSSSSVSVKHSSSLSTSSTLVSPNVPDTATTAAPQADELVAGPDVFPDGIKVLHDCVDAKVDVCFMHGLTGNRERTWTAKGESLSWPQLLLPQKLPQARILTWGYDAYFLRLSTVASRNRIRNHASNLLVDLANERNNAPNRPILFVVHSLGGLVCKEAILMSRNNSRKHLRGIFECLRGIAFMGTPHEGSRMSDLAKIPAHLLGLVASTNQNLLKVLRTDSDYLDSINARFYDLLREQRDERGVDAFEVTCFYEELPMPKINRPVVTEDSATLELCDSYGIHANHREMVRFRSVDETGFKRLVGELTRWKDKEILTDRDNRCLRDLAESDAGHINPEDDKTRIINTKGGLFRDAYRWILGHDDFRQWIESSQSQILWIHGDPGKGKTMLLCGIIDELRELAQTANVPVSYFFCQATNDVINNATAVYRGLILMLVRQIPSLVQHVHARHKPGGKSVFKGINATTALADILKNILEDPILRKTSAFIIIDALDECEAGNAHQGNAATADGDLNDLLLFIKKCSETIPHVKWLVSSRNKPDIESALERSEQKVRLSLELNQGSVSGAVRLYVDHKVKQLATEKGYGEDAHTAVQNYLRAHAHGTFLWVALVCQHLSDLSERETLRQLLPHLLPPGIDALYERMIEQALAREDAQLCKRILGITTVTHRPLSLGELEGLIRQLETNNGDSLEVTELIKRCGSFLTLRNDIVYFVHQSAQDFLVKHAALFADGHQAVHEDISLASVSQMKDVLRYNMYNLSYSNGAAASFDRQGTRIRYPREDPLVLVEYCCIYWVEHACEMQVDSAAFADDGVIVKFLSRHFLHWLETLCLRGRLVRGAVSISRLRRHLQTKNGAMARIGSFLYDAERFISAHGDIIREAPLQIYGGALTFCPEKTEIKRWFSRQRPLFIKRISGIEDGWDSCIQLLSSGRANLAEAEFSTGDSRAVALQAPTVKHDGPGTEPNILNVWDIATGTSVRRIQVPPLCSVLAACSANATVAVATARAVDMELRLYDIDLGVCIQTPREKLYFGNPQEDSETEILRLNFSPDGSQLVAVAKSGRVILWNIKDNTTQSFRNTPDIDYGPEHTSAVPIFGRHRTGASFSDEGQLVVVLCPSGDGDCWFQTWKPVEDECRHQKLNCEIAALTMSPNTQTIAFVLMGWEEIRIWAVQDACYKRVLRNIGKVQPDSVCLSHKGDLVAASVYSPNGGERVLKVWNANTGRLHSIHNLFSNNPAMQFSKSSRLLITRAQRQARVWELPDASMPVVSSTVNSLEPADVAFRLGIWVLVWELLAGYQLWLVILLRCLPGHARREATYARPRAHQLVFSPDGKLLAMSSKAGATVGLYSTKTGTIERRLLGYDDWGIPSSQLLFSNDGQLLLAAFGTRIVIWHVLQGTRKRIILAPESPAECGFTPDVRKILVRYGDRVEVHNLSGSRRVRFTNIAREGRPVNITAMISSHDGAVCAMAAFHSLSHKPWERDVIAMIHLWDVENDKEICAFDDDTGGARLIALSRSGTLLATAHPSAGVIKLWDVPTATCKAKFDHPELDTEEPDLLRRLGFSSDDSELLAFGQCGNTYAWAISNGVEPTEIVLPRADVAVWEDDWKFPMGKYSQLWCYEGWIRRGKEAIFQIPLTHDWTFQDKHKNMLAFRPNGEDPIIMEFSIDEG